MVVSQHLHALFLIYYKNMLLKDKNKTWVKNVSSFTTLCWCHYCSVSMLSFTFASASIFSTKVENGLVLSSLLINFDKNTLSPSYISLLYIVYNTMWYTSKMNDYFVNKHFWHQFVSSLNTKQHVAYCIATVIVKA